MLDDEKAGNPIKLGFGIETTFIRRIIKECYDWRTLAQIAVFDEEASRRNSSKGSFREIIIII
jgi:hypothetical protein